MRAVCVILLSLLLVGSVLPRPAEAQARTRPASEIAALIMPPFSLGPQVNDQGVYSLLNSGGAEAGFVFETGPLAPLPGFSGAAINMLVIIDLNGTFLDVRLLDHNEPIFVSGLGEAPFREFLTQYGGHSISQSIVVGTPYGSGGGSSALVYLDGVTKATASVRIAHESILAATRAVAREKMQGISAVPPAQPDPDYSESLDWPALIEQGIAKRTMVTNAQVQQLFADTRWRNDDPIAVEAPDQTYLDLWILDLGPPAIAKAALSARGLADLDSFARLSATDEPILLIEAGRHGLVGPEFVRNTAPDLLSASQDGLPIALRDADLLIDLAEGAPDGVAMILRTDRRLGFDPARPWDLTLQAQRARGVFQPEIGSVDLTVTHETPERFFTRPGVVKQIPAWQEALLNRKTDLLVLGAGLAALLLVLGPGMTWLSGHRHFRAIRLGILAGVLGFVGWWGQGQLSIVTPLAVLRTAFEGGSLAFMLYDPFSLVIWSATILGFVLWGRGLFCGWLCPFGALQEFAHHLGRLIGLKRRDLPETWDRRLKPLKYVLLAGLVATVVIAPQHVDKAAEIEPFKTAITVFFVREWYYVAYAVLWLGLAMVTYKGFCRYVCPLGAFMALGGLLRGRDWIDRRAECGSPCQLCKVRCNYGAIQKTGEINYSECFQCLDCVTIHDDPAQCVPLILQERRAKQGVAAQ